MDRDNDIELYYDTDGRDAGTERQYEQPSMSAAEVDICRSAVGRNKLVREVIKTVYFYGPVREEQLLAIIQSAGVGSYEEAIDYSFIRRMREQGFLAELALRKGPGSAYVLGNTGRCYMFWRMGYRSLPRDLVAMYAPKYSRLDHDVLIADTITPIMLDIRSLGGSVEWYNAERSPDKGNHYGARWDAYVKGELLGLSFSFVFEADRKTEEGPKFGLKASKYGEYLSRGTWQNALGCADTLPILVVTIGDETRLRNMREAIASALGKLDYAHEQCWLFTTVERLNAAAADGIANPLMASIWDSPYDDVSGVPILPCTLPLARTIQDVQAELPRYAAVPVAARTETTRKLRQLRRVVAGLLNRSQLQSIKYQAKAKANR